MLPVLKALVQRYTQRLYFAVHLSHLHRSGQGRQYSQVLLDALGPQPQLAGFEQALDDMTPPSQRWDGFALIMQTAIQVTRMLDILTYKPATTRKSISLTLCVFVYVTQTRLLVPSSLSNKS